MGNDANTGQGQAETPRSGEDHYGQARRTRGTGYRGGIRTGKATAGLFVTEGAAVVFADIDEAGAAERGRRCRPPKTARPRSSLMLPVALIASAWWTQTVERYGKLDILVTCAGVGDSAPILELDEATFDRTIAVNLKGTFLSAKYAFPALCRQGGSIIALGSVAGLIGAPGFASYGASKAGVIQLMRILAIEGSAHNVRANTICPSWIWTPMVEKAYSD